MPSWAILGAILTLLGRPRVPKTWKNLMFFKVFQQHAILVIFDVLAIILGHLGTIFGHSGATLGHLDRILGHVGAICNHLGTICDLSWDHLRPSWDHFLLFWGRQQGTMPNWTFDAHFCSSWTSSGAILSHFKSHLVCLGEASGPQNLKKPEVF